jgi:phosphoenolpyruvate carboxykinase (ATP)
MAAAGNIHIPPPRPSDPGPLASDFVQQQIARQRNNNYHSTSLRNMVASSVNRTALHPGGVQYVCLSSTCCPTPANSPRPSKGYTELEEELHESAHIDYERVAIVCPPALLGVFPLLTGQIANPSVSALYEDALVYETGTAITSSGALSAYSGTKTGRSPSDKRIVKEESSEKDVWWGPVNKAMAPDVRGRRDIIRLDPVLTPPGVAHQP